MAFFAQNNNYLVANGSIGTFSGASTTGAATVGFLATDGTGKFLSQPTTSICPNKSYVVIVGSGATGTISSASAIGLPSSVGPTGSTGSTTYPLVNVPMSMSTSGLALFTPTASNTTMNLGTGFTATLGNSSGTYLLNASPNGGSVGYTGGAVLTSPLNACPGCACAAGTTCGTGGVCTGTSPCTAGSPCAGTCNGVCAGTNMQCTQGSNGQFSCVPNSTISTWVWWVVGAAAILLLIIIVALIYAYISSRSTEVAPKIAGAAAPGSPSGPDPVQAVFAESASGYGAPPILLTAPSQVPIQNYYQAPPPAYSGPPPYYAPPPPYPQQPLYTASGIRVQ
ncbi:MAG: hypothetical protein Solivirus2_7 [Solivirus sp.]|uniref:Transmembrane protein n=1 Tax=Solivirus sp. TaxID=2487772 RepID=A0A3G5AFE5_9VIRU|nr:MAG: hypothetical protein Solivirus2_7 [Solivirus sp.]